MDEAGVDMDIDQCLVGKFSSLGTTDKDVLIGEFRKLLGFQLNAAGCEFFLDMTNWNLHAAIGAYYDFEMPSFKTPSMSFVSDITIGEGEAVPPNTEFLKTWRIQNSGDEKWPLGCTLRFVNGDKMGAPDWVSVENLEPGQSLDISVKMRSPLAVGLYQGQWKIYTRSMIPFGDPIWVIISVEMGGLLGVTQQMSQFAQALGSPPKTIFDSQLQTNPFSTSTEPNLSEVVFGNPKNTFKTIGNNSNHFANHQNNEDMEMTETSSRDLTTTPELHSVKILSQEPSVSCWNSRSPTIGHIQLDKLNCSTHALHSISEETAVPNNDANFLISNSSYDLTARQATPCNSPNHLLQLERSFNSPDAPSPIKPTTQNSVYQKSPKAAHKLDFSGGI